MKSYIVSMAKGINQVLDKALMEPGFATCLDNADIRSGSIRPFRAPTPVIGLGASAINHLSDGGNALRSIYWSGGTFILSNKDRNYTSESIGDSDRIFFTEYGSTAQKIVSGVQVPLGLRRPEARPTVSTLDSLGVRNFTVAEEAGGNIPKDRVRSYRIALSTDDGILPPTNKISLKATVASVSFRLTWSRSVVSDIPVREIVIFAGDEDRERRIATVPATQTYYLDNGAESGSAGELASNYDLDLDFQYCYTFVRNVRGMEDESGPSPLGLPAKSNNARKILFSTSSDGFFTSPNLEEIVDDAAVAILKLESHAELNTYAISSFALDMDTGMVRVSIPAGNFALLHGGFVKFTGVTGVASDKAYEVVLGIDPEIKSDRDANPTWANTTSFLVDAPITLPQSVVGRSVSRQMTAVIASVTVDHNSSTVAFTTIQDHCFYTGQKITFDGKVEVFDIIVSPIDRKRFFLSGAPYDRTLTNGGYGSNVYAHNVYVRILATPEHGTYPYDSDAVSMDLASLDSNKLSGLYRARTGGRGSFIIDETITADAGPDVAPASPSTLEYVPHNDYIYARRLYRVGDTGEFLKVKDCDPWLDSIIDAKPTISLSDPITSNYTANGIDVTFDIPPQGMTGLVSHYDMKFAICGNTVRWTENGYPDAWAEAFSQDFKYRPQALASWDQGVLVFCEDAVYTLVGNTATSMSVSITGAVDGCIAPNSIQATNAGVFYLSRRGIMLYRNGSAECVTDTRIYPYLFLGTSWTTSSLVNDSNYYWMLSRHEYLYQNLAYSDQLLSHIEGDPGPNIDTRQIPGVIDEIRSFYENGRYYLYWSTNPSVNLVGYFDVNESVRFTSNYGFNSTVVVDTYSPGYPIVTLGFKPRDVYVTENEEVFFLADNGGDVIIPGP